MALHHGFPTPLDGKSAYEIAVDNGFIGTQAQWLDSLIGETGQSAYAAAVAQGYPGTLTEWIASLHGANGQSAYQLAVSLGYSGTLAQWLASLQGPQGTPGVVPNLGEPHEWIINGPESVGISGGAGSYLKIGRLVHLAGEFNVSALFSIITLPFPSAYSISALPIGFTPININQQGATLTIANANESAATITIYSNSGTITFPKVFRFALTYMANS